jgi:hypothetical protein
MGFRVTFRDKINDNLSEHYIPPLRPCSDNPNQSRPLSHGGV